MFCAPETHFRSTEGVGSRFHVLLAWTRFRRCRGRRVPFSCFARPDPFLAVPRALGPVFMFCAPELFFNGTEGVGYRFHVLRSMTRFLRYRGRRIQFLCFARPDLFSAVPKVSAPVFMCCAPELFFNGTKGIVSHFHVLRARTRFRRYQGRRVPFSCYALPNSFPTVPRASAPVLIFCAPGHIFGDTEGSRFDDLRAQTRFR
jgi:hypothetical protein